MLEAIRKRTGSIVVKGLAVLLIVSFGAWGVGDFIQRGVSEETVAEVGDIEITPFELEAEIARELDRLQRQSGVRLDRQQLQAFGLGEQIVQRMVNAAAIDLAVADAGIAISEALVAENIRTDPAFAGLTGGFDRQRFNEVMRALGLSEAQYIARVRREMARDQYLAGLTASGLPRAMAAALHRFQAEKRTARTLLVSDDGRTGIAPPDDAEVRKYYDDHPARFTAPETRKVTYVYLSLDRVAEEIAVGEDELRAAFEDNRHEFTKPERRRVRQFIVADAETAEKAKAGLAAGKSFAEVAREVAGSDEADLDLGLLTRDDLPMTEIADAAFALTEPGVAGPVNSALGWHLLEVSEIQAGEAKTLDEVRDVVTRRIQRDKGLDGLFELANRLEDALGGGATLEEAATEVGAEIRTVEAVDRSGNGRAGQPVTGLPNQGEFIATAFDIDVGTESALIEAGQDGYFILRVDDVTESAVRPLEDVRDQVVEAWLADARRDAAQELAKRLAEATSAGGSVESAAAELGVEPRAVGPVTRSGGGDVALSVVAKMFELKPGEAGIARVEGGYEVVALDRVDTPDPAADAAAVDEMSGRLKSAMQVDLIAQLTDALRTRYGVTVNRRVLDAVFAPGGYNANRS